MLHAALQLHRRAPLDHLVLGHPVDPGGVCEDNWKAGTDPPLLPTNPNVAM